MAESVIGITEGSGKFGHTFQRVIGANTVEDGVVLLGENYLAAYMVLSEKDATSAVATANSHLLQIMAGASLKVRIRRIEVHQFSVITAAAFFDLRLMRLSTAGTGGTVVSTSALDPGDAASGATAMVLPTVKGTENGVVGQSLPYLMQTLAASAPMTSPAFVWDFDRPRSKPLIIAAGAANGIAIKNISSAAAGALVFQVWLDETNFA